MVSHHICPIVEAGSEADEIGDNVVAPLEINPVVWFISQ
jgi:hypothetical protein